MAFLCTVLQTELKLTFHHFSRHVYFVCSYLA